jgi:hypothetical protein
MSLINDALNRAKKSQQSDPPSGAQPLSPVEPDSRNGANWIFIVVVALLIAAACFFIGLAFAKRKSPAAVVAPPPVTNTQPVAVVPPKPPAPKTNIVATPKPPAPPPLKVQGIFYNANRPEAIVNGHTVYVGDLVSGFRVKEISQNDVSFVGPDGTEEVSALGK